MDCRYGMFDQNIFYYKFEAMAFIIAYISVCHLRALYISILRHIGISLIVMLRYFLLFGSVL